MGLSRPSKMPGLSYGLPARECMAGSKLRDVENSTCANCYALKGMYSFPSVQAAQYRRLESIQDIRWVESMVVSIGDSAYFRWHDSGDIQSRNHLHKIIDVCKRTPNTRHWMPTREVKLIRQYIRANRLPDNLTIRISATMIDKPAAKVSSDFNRFLCTSTVHNNAPPIGYACPAPLQGNMCGDCRACWDSTIDNISYGKH